MSEHPFSNAVKEGRTRMGYSQAELADLTGIKRINIAQLERGQTIGTLRTFSIMCLVLNLDAQAIIEAIARDALSERKEAILNMAKLLEKAEPTTKPGGEAL